MITKNERSVVATIVAILVVVVVAVTVVVVGVSVAKGDLLPASNSNQSIENNSTALSSPIEAIAIQEEIRPFSISLISSESAMGLRGIERASSPSAIKLARIRGEEIDSEIALSIESIAIGAAGIANAEILAEWDARIDRIILTTPIA